MAKRNMRFSVENFGPVRSGEFELKPLTIFIGPNNSGKSYMALLVHALCQALASRQSGLFSFSRRFGLRNSYTYRNSFHLSGEKSHQFDLWLRNQKGDEKNVPFDQLPENIQAIVTQAADSFQAQRSGDVHEALHDYFGYEAMKELIRFQKRRKSLSFHLADGDAPFLSFRLMPSQQTGTIKWSKLDLSSLVVPVAEMRQRSMPADFLLPTLIIDHWFDQLAKEGMPHQEAYYLPSARSGILQGWQIYASMALQVVRRRIGLEPIEVAPFTGVAGDFLEVLYERLFTSPRRPRTGKMQPALDILEGHVFRGHVSMEQTRAERPVMLYSSNEVNLPLQRASSMVAELAPLDLWIKYLFAPGDLLIIDEPEAHLHPENQRNIARVLVRLVRAGVRVLCPTHSSLILHQVSNHILASQVDSQTREKLGFTEDDLIDSDDVGVFLFNVQPDGTHITSVTIDPEFGISEDEFVRVAESIGDETYHLSLAAAESDDASN